MNQEQTERLMAENERILALVRQLAKWQEPDAVLGNGDYDQGLMCGVEDRGLQKNGYDAMRYGYDRALERVAEEIDGTIAEILSGAPK